MWWIRGEVILIFWRPSAPWHVARHGSVFQAIESVYFFGGNARGVNFILRFARRPKRAGEFWFVLRLPDGRQLEHLQSPETQVYDCHPNRLQSDGLHISCEEPMSRWRVFFSGFMRCVRCCRLSRDWSPKAFCPFRRFWYRNSKGAIINCHVTYPIARRLLLTFEMNKTEKVHASSFPEYAPSATYTHRFSFIWPVPIILFATVCLISDLTSFSVREWAANEGVRHLMKQ